MLFVRDYLNDQRIHRSDDASENPLVSVILPTHNRFRSGLLERSINSVLAQTFGDFELIVIDDGSRDGSRDFLERCCASDSRVAHVRHELNSGLPAVRVNEGITLARGRYVAFQFDDDVWRPDALKLLTDAAQKQGDAAVIVGTAQYFSQGAPIYHLPNNEVNHTNLLAHNFIANNSFLIPRNLFDIYGMYDCHIAMRRLCDYDLWLRMIRGVPFLALDDVIADIYSGLAGSLERTAPNDLSLFRYLHDIPRDHLLTPDRWMDYEVDALKIGHVALQGDRLRRLYEEQLVPYYLKMRHRLSAIDRIPAQWSEEPVRDALLVRKNSSGYYRHSFFLYDDISSRRGTYKIHHEHPRGVTAETIRSDADVLMLVGLHEPHDECIAQVAQDAGLPIAYFLDNDLFQRYQARMRTPGFDPATTDYRSLARLLVEADAVWVSGESNARSALAYNRRTILYTGCIPPELLPDALPSRDPDRAITIGYICDGLGVNETGFLWEALERISDEFGTALEFVFWGADFAELPRFHSSMRTEPLPSTYTEYLRRLRESHFDILLAPRLGHLRSRSDAAPPQYHCIAVARALGIVSDATPDAPLTDGKTCLSASNTTAGWLEALRRAITMPIGDFDRMRSACIDHVRETSTSRALVDQYEAAWKATEFHHLTRERRSRDGRPCVAFFLHTPFLGGAEIHLWRRLKLLSSYGITPVAVVPESYRYEEATHEAREELSRLGIELAFAQYVHFAEPKTSQDYFSQVELDSVRFLLNELNPALVHSTTFIPSVGQACRELNIPHVASLYQIEEHFESPPDAKVFYQSHCDLVMSDSIRYARRWRDLLGVETCCSRAPVPESLFEQGRLRMSLPHSLPSSGGEHSPSRPMRVVLLGALQPRKGQLAAISAVGTLRREGVPLRFVIYGYTKFYPDYLKACEERIAEDQTQGTVSFHGFDRDVAPALQGADILLCSSTFESFPTSISEAMAAGVLVVTTPAGGIPELIVDGDSGILCRGFSDLDILDGLRRAIRLSDEERARIISQARRVALAEFHPSHTANDLFTAYSKAIRKSRSTERPDATHAHSSKHEPSAEHVPLPEPVLPVEGGRTSLFALRRLARKTDTLLLRLMKITPPHGARPGQTSSPPNHELDSNTVPWPPAGDAVLHPPHTLRGPHLLGRAYCRLRKFARAVDNTLRIAKGQFRQG